MNEWSDSERARLTSIARDEASRWHLDKKVPIALILALFMHLGGSVWFFRGLVAEVQETKKDIVTTQRRIDTLEAARSAERVSERLAVVESQVGDIRGATLRMEVNVQRLVERRQTP